jgi:hypothetical protein
MTTQEARIIVLEDALRQAQNLVEFLHGCLTRPAKTIPAVQMNGAYKYEYPESTLEELKKWSTIAPRSNSMCYHSMHVPDCESCQEHLTESRLLTEAKRILK